MQPCGWDNYAMLLFSIKNNPPKKGFPLDYPARKSPLKLRSTYLQADTTSICSYKYLISELTHTPHPDPTPFCFDISSTFPIKCPIPGCATRSMILSLYLWSHAITLKDQIRKGKTPCIIMPQFFHYHSQYLDLYILRGVSAHHQILPTKLDHIVGNRETTRRQYIARDADATYVRSNKDGLNTELIHKRKSIDGFTTKNSWIHNKRNFGNVTNICHSGSKLWNLKEAKGYQQRHTDSTCKDVIQKSFGLPSSQTAFLGGEVACCMTVQLL